MQKFFLLLSGYLSVSHTLQDNRVAHEDVMLECIFQYFYVLDILTVFQVLSSQILEQTS